MSKTGLSLSAMEAAIASEQPEPFEPILPNGETSGIVLMIRSDQHPEVQASLNAIANRQRKRAQVAAEKAKHARAGSVVTPIEDDIADVREMAAVRLAGWNGIDDDFNLDNAVRLLKVAPGFIAQIVEKAQDLAGFTKASSKTS